jgi:hypothetical protein
MGLIRTKLFQNGIVKNFFSPVRTVEFSCGTLTGRFRFGALFRFLDAKTERIH